MAGIILCRTKVAQNPYYISNVDLNIYSMEELCYYIYNNIYLIGMDLVDYELIGFIREELEEKALAARLDSLKRAKAGLSELIITILKYVDYYSSSEVEDIREILETLNTQNVYERLKMRGDTLLENKKYMAAIKNYETIINGEHDSMLPGLFYAQVYHNLGCAYGNLFLYRNARQNFAKAYEIGQHEESKKCIIATYMLDENFNGKKMFDENDEETFVFEREIETVLDACATCPGVMELEELERLRDSSDGDSYYEQINCVIEKYKRDYIKYTS